MSFRETERVMRGQWIGTYTGNSAGDLIINIDETKENFQGVAYVNPTDKNLPSSAAHFDTEDKLPNQKVVAYVFPIDPRSGFQCEWDDIKHLYGENITFSKRVEVSFDLHDGKLKIEAANDIGVQLSSVITARLETVESKISGVEMSWSQFKDNISQRSKSKFLFRGQQKTWRLSTSFHRRGRYRMSQFTNHDVKQLHRRLSAITTHYFDLSVAEENGAFFNLMQHHGYPTPLLDWSYSPYVAAFFAFRDWPINYSGDDKVRIYLFNEQAWHKDFPRIQNLDPPFLHLSVMEFIAIDNPRLVPQQSVTTVTNIDNIETYIADCEINKNTCYLEAIDIPASEREEAMRDLKFMGITAGSMFPNLDGVCEELRESNFDR